MPQPGRERIDRMTSRQPELAFEASIFNVVRTAARMTRKDPRFAIRALRLLRRQRAAAKLRDEQERRGVHVPPFLIYSVTGQCNFDCAGCYANLLHKSDREELSDEQMDQLLTEVEELGSSIMLIAGGEPLMRPQLLGLTAKHPEILFLLFTNGSLLDGRRIEQLQSQKHVIPVLSIEGDPQQTDRRRGEGAHAGVLHAMKSLRRNRIFFGTSTTLTRENFDLTTSENHLRPLIEAGCRLFYYINYVPVAEGTEDLQLDPAQVNELEARLIHHRRKLPALFIAFPHDEMALGGCLAAGRGFLHINAYGDVEPCPFSPFSDTNLKDSSFEEALASPLLQHILSSDVVLDETDGQCALWKQREWVKRLLDHGQRSGNE